MCGITGFLYLHPSSQVRSLETSIHCMTNTLGHRGPDGAGVWLDQESGIALGHRRLAIRDLSSLGAQPMVSHCGNFIIVYNGEVYSHQEIAKDLRQQGRRLRGESDTEVILEACALWGVESVVPRLIGMFAFALYDRRQRSLTLVRDRLGIKPLYWGIVANTLIFGSELKALCAFPSWSPHLDRSSLAGFMRYGYIPAPQTIYQDIFKLMPGHLVSFGGSRSGHLSNTSLPRPYWNLKGIIQHSLATPLETTTDIMINDLDTLLQDAVRRRLVADVPVGSFLSGGIDSSLVTALMCEQSSQPVHTFSIGFEDHAYNEAPAAAAIAAHLGTHHTELYLKSTDILPLIEKIPYWYDEPFADSSQIPTLSLSHLTRQQVTVALSGDGGDEVFAGYSRYQITLKVHQTLAHLSRFLGLKNSFRLFNLALYTAHKCGFLLNPIPFFATKLARFDHLIQSTPFKNMNAIYRFFMSHWQNPNHLILSDTDEAIQEHLGLFDNPSLDADFPYLLDRLQFFDLSLYLPDDILTKVDRASMSVGLEVRVPLLDHRVIEYAWRLPTAMKLQDGQSKWILRQILDKRIPRSLMDRPKQGFGVPLATWLRGPLKDWARALLDPSKIRQQKLFQADLVDQQWQAHLSGQNHASPLWNLLMAQAWLDAHPEITL